MTLAALGFVLRSLGPFWTASITATAVRLGALEAVAEAPTPSSARCSRGRRTRSVGARREGRDVELEVGTRTRSGAR